MKSFRLDTVEVQLLVQNSPPVLKIHRLLSASDLSCVLQQQITILSTVSRTMKWLSQRPTQSGVKIFENVHHEILRIPRAYNYF